MGVLGFNLVYLRFLQRVTGFEAFLTHYFNNLLQQSCERDCSSYPVADRSHLPEVTQDQFTNYQRLCIRHVMEVLLPCLNTCTVLVTTMAHVKKELRGVHPPPLQHFLILKEPWFCCKNYITSLCIFYIEAKQIPRVFS